MIKANELRIGNKVLMAHENAIETVNARMISYISQAEAKNHPHPFEPIPLTPEILEKAGFKKEHDKTFNSATVVDYVHPVITIKNTIQGDFYANVNNKTVHIKSVHQLQNLVFAITSKELTTLHPSVETEKS